MCAHQNLCTPVRQTWSVPRIQYAYYSDKSGSCEQGYAWMYAHICHICTQIPLSSCSADLQPPSFQTHTCIHTQYTHTTHHHHYHQQCSPFNSPHLSLHARGDIFHHCHPGGGTGDKQCTLTQKKLRLLGCTQPSKFGYNVLQNMKYGIW